MSSVLENYGLQLYTENEEAYCGLVAENIKDGKPISGYSEMPYISNKKGDIEFWVHTLRTDNNTFEAVGLDARCANMCLWEMVHTGIEITPKKWTRLSKIALFHSSRDTNGLVPIEVMNADVLPSFMEEDKIAMQMVARPMMINYYENYEEYEKEQTENQKGKKYLIANGSLIAVSFLINHSEGNYEESKEYPSDRYVHFNATVKKLYNGTFELGDKKYNTFIRCMVETEFGELEFDHTIEQVPEEQRDNIKVGAVISGVCILSADVAILEYEKGIVKDFEHNLKLLKYTLVEGNAERLYPVLSKEAFFETETYNEKFYGPKAIIDRFNYVHSGHDGKYSACFANLIEGTDEALEYKVGTRCILLSDDAGETVESIVFMDVDEDGNIKKIKVSTDSRYRFRRD